MVLCYTGAVIAGLYNTKSFLNVNSWIVEPRCVGNSRITYVSLHVIIMTWVVSFLIAWNIHFISSILRRCNMHGQSPIHESDGLNTFVLSNSLASTEIFDNNFMRFFTFPMRNSKQNKYLEINTYAIGYLWILIFVLQEVRNNGIPYRHSHNFVSSTNVSLGSLNAEKSLRSLIVL